MEERIFKREILGLYDEDFYKIDPTGKAASLFRESLRIRRSELPPLKMMGAPASTSISSREKARITFSSKGLSL